MDYKHIYDSLISKARSENRVKGGDTYYEAHHIVPKSMGGEGLERHWKKHPNIILLTGREHYVAHQLLHEIYPNNISLTSALWGMTNQRGSTVKRTYKPSSRQYERYRIDHSNAMVKLLTKTKKEFIEQSNKIHGNKYDYSKVIYVGCDSKVIIKCPQGHEFKQTPDNHISGRGCNKCSKNKLKTNEEFKNELVKVFGDKYDYSKVKYVHGRKTVTLICKIHGEFNKTANDLVNVKTGCQECSKENFINNLNEKSKEEFFIKGNEKYNSFYDLSEVVYVDSQVKVTIICPEHGRFKKTPASFLFGERCQKCSFKSRTIKRTGMKLPTVREKLGKKITINGNVYFSREHASEKTGISVYYIRKRIKDDNYPNYYYTDDK